MASPPETGAEADDDRCPSCDTAGAWRLTRPHRISPFGGVAVLVLAFWVTVLGWLLDLGFLPAAAVAGTGVLLLTLRRKAEICEACGFVRPRQR